MIRMFSQYVIIALLSLLEIVTFSAVSNASLCQMLSTQNLEKKWGWVRLKEQRHCVSILIVCKKTTLLSWVMAFRKNAEVLLQICPNFRISMLAWRETLKETLKKIVIDADWCGKENYHHSSKEARHTNLGECKLFLDHTPPHAEFRSPDFWLWLWYMDGLHSCRHPNTRSALNAAHNDWAKNVNHAINFSQSLLVLVVGRRECTLGIDLINF